ncbi:tetratricopeptide repeat protein [Thermohalobacter berrensis]|uniref:Uncharacterized protein n=1 Tax=Thermohalobacter berrensis TaxID=99594 RepID=A0A419T561_9FIRM|nr:tetratricopeptide repeat protein [Thermohalobacter berrensis]RKD32573.1 hypothetical protein BET03_10890 [Thermohalobacter berrensis]
MKSVNEYFKEKTENLSFIELKPGSFIDINGYKITDEIPLPIVIDELITEIKERRAQDELKVSSMIRGMIYTIGVDPKFKYFDDYKKILYKYDNRIEHYILYRGIDLIKEGSFDEGIIFLRALTFLNSENVNGLYNYGVAIEKKAESFYKLKQPKKGKEFLIEAIRTFETILDINPNFPMAYYKLGFHYKNMKQFKKSQIMWEKSLEFDISEDIKEEIEANLLDIKDDVIYEEGYNEILRGNPKAGIKKLLPLKDKYSDWWNLLFLIGLGYRQLGEYDKAIKEFKNVLAVNPGQVDTYNELGLCYASLGKFEDAIENFTKAIERRPNDYEIICNRGLTYLQLGDKDRASKDIERAYELNPQDEITITCKRELEKYK